MLLESIEFFERAVVQQKLDAFAGGHLSRGVLAFDSFASAARESRGVLFSELLQPVACGFLFDLAFRSCHF